MAKKNKCPFCGKSVGGNMKEHLMKVHPKEVSRFEIPDTISGARREMLEEIYDEILEERRARGSKNFKIAATALVVIVIVAAAFVFWPTVQDSFAKEENNGGAGENGGGSSDNTEMVTHTKVRIETTYGNIDLELYDDRAPVTVDNFLKYVDDGFYDGLIFHRVIKNFMIQGGGFYPDMTQKQATYPPIKNEAATAKLRNNAGTIAMARTSDPNSATSQFYINEVDNHFLDWDQAQDGYGYCVFGKVTQGMDVVHNIASVETHEEKGYQDVPVNDIIISRVYVTGTVEVPAGE